MIFTLLFQSNMLCDNPHRFIYMYALGMVMYVIIHWLLFSPAISNNYVLKYRTALYAVLSLDVAYVISQYKKFKDACRNDNDNDNDIDTNRHIIEEIPEDNTDTSSISLPIYVSAKNNGLQ